MGARKKVQLPYEVLINGNARMWYSIFKAMKRKEFVEYVRFVRNHIMHECYATRALVTASDA